MVCTEHIKLLCMAADMVYLKSLEYAQSARVLVMTQTTHRWVAQISLQLQLLYMRCAELLGALPKTPTSGLNHTSCQVLPFAEQLLLCRPCSSKALQQLVNLLLQL